MCVRSGTASLCVTLTAGVSLLHLGEVQNKINTVLHRYGFQLCFYRHCWYYCFHQHVILAVAVSRNPNLDRNAKGHFIRKTVKTRCRTSKPSNAKPCFRRGKATKNTSSKDMTKQDPKTFRVAQGCLPKQELTIQRSSFYPGKTAI